MRLVDYLKALLATTSTTHSYTKIIISNRVTASTNGKKLFSFFPLTSTKVRCYTASQKSFLSLRAGKWGCIRAASTKVFYWPTLWLNGPLWTGSRSCWDTWMHPHITEAAQQRDHGLNCSVAWSVFNVGLIHSPLHCQKAQIWTEMCCFINEPFHKIAYCWSLGARNSGGLLIQLQETDKRLLLSQMGSTLQNVNLLDKWLASLYLFPFAFISRSIDAKQPLAKTIWPTAALT